MDKLTKAKEDLRQACSREKVDVKEVVRLTARVLANDEKAIAEIVEQAFAKEYESKI